MGHPLRVNLEEFVAFLKSRHRPAIPMDVVTKESVFAPFWYDYVTFVSSKVEELDQDIADMHNVLLYHIPTVAVVPRSDVFVVFVRKEEYDDVYLAYNYAVVSMDRGKHLYVVPFIDDRAVDTLVKNKINPAVLNETLYILPTLTTIPCTSLLKEVPLIREFLTIKMQSYITSDDVAFVLLGYILLKLLALSKSQQNEYERVFEEAKSIVLKALEKRLIYVKEHKLSTAYAEFPVDIVVIEIRPSS